MRSEAEWLRAEAERTGRILDSVTSHTDAHLAYLDRDFNFIWVNSTYADRCGHSKEELTGRNHFQFFPNPENQAIFEQVRDTGTACEAKEKPFEYPKHPEWGVSYWDWTLTPINDRDGRVEGFAFSLREVTETVRARQQIEALRAEAERNANELDAVFASLTDALLVFDEAGDIARANETTLRLYGFDPVGRHRDELLRSLRICYPDGNPVRFEQLPSSRALRGETVVSERFSFTNLYGKRVTALTSAAPLRSESGISGAVTILHDITELEQAEQELEAAYRHEQRIATVLQNALISEVSLDVPGYEMGGSYQPALAEAKIGGDFYDAFRLSDGRVALILGDVAGKGIEAAVYIAMCKNILRGFALEMPSPAITLERLDNALRETLPSTEFITLAYALLDPATGGVRYASGGHEPAILYRLETDSACDVAAPGHALGSGAPSEFREITFTLDQGDVLVMYTDGISDAGRPRNRYGPLGIGLEIVQHSRETVKDLIAHIMTEAAKRDRADRSDDKALLVVRRGGSSESS